MNECEEEITQSDIDKKNSQFWNELCGTTLAHKLGITDNSKESLLRFDRWYFDHYPYLDDHIPFNSMEGKKALEIGLGYGSVAQRLIEHGADYYGLDIAAGPVEMVTNRLNQTGKIGNVQRGSILSPPFDKESFDWIIAVGCLHHTGNLSKAIDNVYSLLKPNGKAMIMVYSASSYRQWWSSPKNTLRRLLSSPKTYQKQTQSVRKMRAAYDTNLEGDAAPQTEFVTKSELKYLCRKFSKVSVDSENIGNEGFLSSMSRPLACKIFGQFFGLDLYCSLQK